MAWRFCDHKDNDCNGQTDEDVTTTYYLDSDHDGYGVDTDHEELCDGETDGDYSTKVAGDCDDTNPDVHPDATDTCDGIDDDCDTVIDPASCKCINGHTTDCYTGAAGTKGVGPCHKGTSTCAGGNWGSCQNEVTPTTETANNVDDDCDGVVDEGFACDVNGTSQGVCANGTVNATTGGCDAPADYEAGDETSCDGKDNDCDGQKDEGLKVTFVADRDGDGFGDPNDTVQACAGSGPAGYIEQAYSQGDDCDDQDADTYPGAPELCDGRQNDCSNTSYTSDGNLTDTNSWCATHYNDARLRCRADGPGASICCEVHGDRDTVCDFESNCSNGVDDDGNDGADCADPDCDQMYCAPGKTCQNSTCTNAP